MKSVIKEHCTGKTVLLLGLLLLLAASAFTGRFAALEKSPYANGLDGYFYVGQVHFLLEEGAFRIPDSSPVLYLLAAFSLPFSELVTAVKAGSALMNSLLLLTAALTARRLFADPGEENKAGRRSPGMAAVLAASLFALSPSLSQMGSEYLKNLGGLLFFFLFLLTVLSMLQPGLANTRSETATAEDRTTTQGKAACKTLLMGCLAALFALLSLFAHRLIAGMLLLLLFLISLMLAGEYFLRSGSSDRSNKRRPRFVETCKARMQQHRVLLLTACLLVCIALPLLLILVRGGLHPADLARFDNVISLRPNTPLFSQTFQMQLPVWLLAEMSLAQILAPLLLLFSFRHPLPDRRQRRLYRALLVMAILMSNPFWKLDSLDMGYRMHLAAAPLTLFLATGPLARFIRNAAQKNRGGLYIRHIRRSAAIVFIAGILLVAYLLPGHLYRPQKDPPYAFYEKLLGQFSLPKDSMLICHQGLNLFYTYTTGKNGLNYIPEYHVAEEKLWRLACHVPFQEFRRIVPEAVETARVKRLQYPYHLLREDVWQQYLERIPGKQAASHNNWYNPHQTRPEFLQVHQQGTGYK